MKELFFLFLKILFFTGICYLLLLTPAIPFIIIPDNVYPNVLSSILIKQSSFLFSGIIIIIFSKYLSFYTNINFRLSRALIYYLSTLLVILIFCLILNLLKITEFYSFRITNKYSFGKFLIFCTIPTFFIAFGEEFIFRWFLINRLKTFLKTIYVIVISALIFCLGHNWNLPNMMFAFIGGCLFALIYVKTDSVFNCIGIHAAWNFGQRFFFNGMSEFSYNAQRFILFDIRNPDLYNWVEFLFGVCVLLSFVIYYVFKDKNKQKYFK